MVEQSFKTERNIYDNDIRHAISMLSEAIQTSVAGEDATKQDLADGVSTNVNSVFSDFMVYYPLTENSGSRSRSLDIYGRPGGASQKYWPVGQLYRKIGGGPQIL